MKQLIEFELTVESKRLKNNVIKFQNQTNIGALMTFKSCTRFRVNKKKLTRIERKE